MFSRELRNLRPVMMMQNRHMGRQTVAFSHPPVILAESGVGGRKEGEGPLGGRIENVEPDAYFGQPTWEAAESAMLRRCLSQLLANGGTDARALDCILAGDLQNQCAGAAYAVRGVPAPYLGLYNACATFAEAVGLACVLLDGGYARLCAALTGSHFSTAERQYRFPMEYGGVRTPTAQWTVTGAGALLLGSEGRGPRVTHFTAGIVADLGVTDLSNMGAAMAPAAVSTLKAHFSDTGRSPADYDLILTGDLGHIGHAIVSDLMARDGLPLGERYDDCGRLIFDREAQDVHAGGSGAGCSALVTACHVMKLLRSGERRRVLLAATGALMSPTSAMQGESLPAVCHAVVLEREAEV